MKKFIFFLVTLVIFGFFQFDFIPYLGIKNYFPNLFLILIIYFSLNSTMLVTLNFGFWAGLLEDAINSNVWGVNIILFLLIGFFLSNLKDKIIKNYFSLSIILFFASLLHFWGSFLIFKVFSYPVREGLIFSWIYPFYNLVFGLVIFPLIDWWVKLWKIST